MLFEIVNPSDPYTMTASDFKVAAAATILLGQGKLGLECDEDSTLQVPLFLFASQEDVEGWFEKVGIHPIDDFIEAHREEVAACLDSVLIGSQRERRAFEKMIAAVTNEKDRERARDAYHDEKRSSMNDIGASAWEIAKALRAPRRKKVTPAGRSGDVP